MLPIHLENHKGISLVAAKKEASDARIVMNWRNDPTTRKMFYNQEEKSWGSFFEEYCSTYFLDNSLPPCFAEIQNEKIAFLRSSKYQLDGHDGVYDIDINVNPAFRGQGLGSKVLRIFSKYIVSHGATAIVAEIKEINTASKKAFLNAGFLPFDEKIKIIGDENCPIVRYIFK